MGERTSRFQTRETDMTTHRRLFALALAGMAALILGGCSSADTNVAGADDSGVTSAADCSGEPAAETHAAQAGVAQAADAAEPLRIVVLWTSGDPDVAHRMVLMYTHAAHRAKWADEVRLIVWGPSARLLAADKDIEAKIRAMMKDGIQVQACVVCADSYGVSDDLRAMGIEVKGMGKPLTDYVRDGWEVLTF